MNRGKPCICAVCQRGHLQKPPLASAARLQLYGYEPPALALRTVNLDQRYGLNALLSVVHRYRPKVCRLAGVRRMIE